LHLDSIAFISIYGIPARFEIADECEPCINRRTCHLIDNSIPRPRTATALTRPFSSRVYRSKQQSQATIFHLGTYDVG